MKRPRFLILSAALFLASIFSAFSAASPVSAASFKDLTNRYLVAGFQTCYGKMKSSFSNGQVQHTEDFWKSPKTKVVGLYPGYDSKKSDDTYTCPELFDKLGIKYTYSINNTGDELADFGYKGGNGQLRELFWFGTNGQKTSPVELVASGTSGSGDSRTITAKTTLKTGTSNLSSGKFSQPGNNQLKLDYDGKSVTVKYTPGTTTWSKLLSDLEKAIQKEYGSRYITRESLDPNAGQKYTHDTSSDAWKKSYKALLGSAAPALNYPKEQKAALYSNILSGYFGVQTAFCDADKSKVEKNKNDSSVKDFTLTAIYNSGGKREYCYVKPQNNVGKKVFGAEGGSSKMAPSMVDKRSTFADLAKWLLNNAPEKIDPGFLKNAAENLNSAAASGDKDAEAVCFDNAGPLGWILCPVITAISDTANQIYGWIEKNFLIVDVNIFNEDDAMYKAWSSFQNFANIAFVILFLIVIFSQLTGIGLDNFGIKKILPRLIVTILLINLSWIICQLAVDISNILGVSLRTIFGDLTSNLEVQGYAASTAQNAASGGFTILGIGAAATAIFTSPALILTFLLTILSCAISVIFLWFVLVARELGVIICIVLSPLAFAAYMLPNTQSLYRRWFSIFRGVLLVFPICGLMMGASYFASALLGGSEQDSAIRLAAMIIRVIPFFLIPTVLRGSLQAMGNLGATLNNLGNRFQAGTVGRIRRSEAFDRAQTAANSFDPGGLRSRFANSRFGKATGLQRVRARQLRAQLKQEAQEGRDGLLTDSGYLERVRGAEKDKIFGERVATEESVLSNSDAWRDKDENELTRQFTRILSSGSNQQIVAASNLAASDKVGRQAFANALSSITADENYGVGEEGGERDRNIRRAITANMGDWKAHDNSIASWASRENGKSDDYSDYTFTKNAALANDVNGRSMVNDLDKGRLKEIAKGIEEGEIKGDAAKAYAAAAQNALDAKANGNLGIDKEREDALNTIVQNVPAPVVQPSSGNDNPADISIPHNSQPAPAPRTQPNPSNPTPRRQPLDSRNATDLGTRAREAQTNPDGSLNIRGEGTYRQTDSGIIIPGRNNSK